MVQGPRFFKSLKISGTARRQHHGKEVDSECDQAPRRIDAQGKGGEDVGERVHCTSACEHFDFDSTPDQLGEDAFVVASTGPKQVRTRAASAASVVCSV